MKPHHTAAVVGVRPPADVVLALQRVAGNRAVRAALQRDVVGSPKRAPPFLGVRRPPEVVLALQRAAGNRAVRAALQRDVVGSGASEGVKFTIGQELTPAFATAAKAAVADGVVDETDLNALKQTALQTGGATGGADRSVNDDERMFMAGLLDPANAARLRGQAFAATGATITFPAATITSANRAHVANLGRGGLPADVAAEQQAEASARAAGDLIGTAIHGAAKERDAVAAIARMAGTGPFLPVARTVLDQATDQGISATTVLNAMIAAASDSTEGDRVLAGAVYVIAQASGSTLQADLLAGRIKVDEVPHTEMGPDEWAGYKAVGLGKKGDTIYLPSDFDPTILAHRAAVVHELKHAEDDKAAAGPRVHTAARDQMELDAYRRQNRWVLETIDALNGFERIAAIRSAATIWNAVDAVAMALEARADRPRFEPILRAVNALGPPGTGLPAPLVTNALSWPEPRVEAAALSFIQHGYQLLNASGTAVDPAKNKAIQDGLSGESVLDWWDRR